MNNRIARGSIVAGALVLGMSAVGTADEVRQQLNPSMILNMLARPIESPEGAFNAALKSDPTAPRPVRLYEGDGRGKTNLTITVRNPCPPGDFAHEAAYLRSLPGRARR